VRAVIRFAGRWIAGGLVPFETTSRAAVWTSVDGISWNGPTLIDPEPTDRDGFPDRHWINGFGLWNGDLLAFGWNGICCGDGGFPRLWRSPDGETWEVVDIDGTPFGDDYHFPHSSTVNASGELVVFSGIGLGTGTAAFMTADLQTWETFPITEPANPVFAAAVAGSPARFLAGGMLSTWSEADQATTETSVAWTSTDGRTWQPIAPPDVDGTIDDIAWDAVHDRFVAVGVDADGIPHAWLTEDGSRWSAIPLADEPMRMQAVTAADGLIVATGLSGSVETGVGETFVWSSHDGITWWYGSVLDRQAGTIVGAVPGTALLLTSMSGRDGWVPLVGVVIPAD